MGGWVIAKPLNDFVFNLIDMNFVNGYTSFTSNRRR